MFTLTCLLLLASASALAEPKAELLARSKATLAHPHDVVLGPDGRLLYVADMNNDRVAVFDAESLVLVGEIGKGELRRPHDLAFDQSGFLRVADSRNNRVLAYQVQGANGRAVAGSSVALASPEGLVFDYLGRMFVGTVGDAHVRRYEQGELHAKVGGWGGGPGQFRRPHDVEAGRDGRVYVADSGNHRIQVFDGNLKFIAEYGGHKYGFNDPKYLAVDDKDRLYVLDQNNNRLVILDRSGKILATFGGDTLGVRLNRPEGIEVVGERLWIADTYNDRLLAIRLTGLDRAQVPADREPGAKQAQ